MAAEQALALLLSGEVSSQTAAAAALGISKGQLSVAKAQHKPPYFKFNQQRTERVTVCDVTYTKELGCGDERRMPLAAKKTRAARNYRSKMAALREAARKGSDLAGRGDLAGAGLDVASAAAPLTSEEEGQGNPAPAMPPRAVLKEEGTIPPMPAGALVKEEVFPLMPQGAFVKEEVFVKREHEIVVDEGGRSEGRPKRRKNK